jgi:hypothetical protein
MTVWDGDQDDADIDLYCKEMRAAAERGRPYVSLTWMKKYVTSDRYRRRIADLFIEIDALIRANNICSAIITRSIGFRFVLSAFFLLKPLPTPYKVCANFEEAMTFCREEAAKRGVTLPVVKPLVPDA